VKNILLFFILSLIFTGCPYPYGDGERESITGPTIYLDRSSGDDYKKPIVGGVEMCHRIEGDGTKLIPCPK